jgi:hypothetical protein
MQEQMLAGASGSNQTCISNFRDVAEVVSSIRGKLCQKSPIPSCSIFRVPNKLRRHNEKAFEPELISIGPFHHGKEKLQPMQKIKLWYLHCFLNRAPTKETNLECFVPPEREKENRNSGIFCPVLINCSDQRAFVVRLS